MAGTPSLFAGIGAQFFDNAGNVLTGGKIYSYQAGTTTPIATYTTEMANVAHSNPIILDASGRVPSGGEIWLKTGDFSYYKFVLKDVNDVLIATYDFVPGTYTQSDLGIVSITSFGAVGDGVTNNVNAITNAIADATANNKPVYVPVDAAGGNYAITSGTLTIPSTAKIIYDGAARIFTSGAGVIANTGTHACLLGGGGIGDAGRLEKILGLRIDINGGVTGLVADGGSYRINRIRVLNDSIDATNDANPGSKVDALFVQHTFGGVDCRGGRHAGEFALGQNAITASDNPDRNYVGLAATSTTLTGDGGSPGNNIGGYFGINPVAANIGGRYIANLTAMEANTVTTDLGGSEVGYHAGIQIVSTHRARGGVDTAIAISLKSSSTVKYKTGIQLGDMNGENPLGTDSAVMRVTADTTIRDGFALPECTDNILESGKVTIRNNKFNSQAPAASLELGAVDGTVSSSFIDLHSSGNNIDYDVRLQCAGGSATIGSGALAVLAGDFSTSCQVRPNADDAYSLGTASRRWSVVYAATGTINTSDEKSKQDIEDLSEAEKQVALKLKKLIRKFRFKNAVAVKGDDARIHVGVIAQDVIEAFKSEGLDPMRYGVVCYDEWDEQPEMLDTEGNVIKEYRAKGDSYGVRYEELFAFVISAL